MSWEVVRGSGRRGTGNWDGFDIPMAEIFTAAEIWKQQVGLLERPWLCWNISDRWSLLQQRMVLEAGWTPVVGFDPNCRPKRLSILPGAVHVDFASPLGLTAMWPHFPLEFSHLWAPRLAFWHADLLMPMQELRRYAAIFSSLQDGEMSAVFSTGGLRNIFRKKYHRYWELIGCTTAEAGRHQYENGCGWWRHFNQHPNTPSADVKNRSGYWYDSGVGVAYWENKYRRKVVRLKEAPLICGHCSEIGHPNYKKSTHKGVELELNFDLDQVAKKFDLTWALA